MAIEVKITKWETEDGRTFDTKELAERHEIRCELEEILGGNDDDWKARRWGRADAPDLDAVVDRLIVNAPRMIRLLQRFVEPTEAVIDARKTVEIQDIVLSQRGKV